jgi:predicted metal-binding protein
MEDLSVLEGIFVRHGCPDFKWIKSRGIAVASWVRMKCSFGCPSFGKSLSCPPHVPSIPECRIFFDEYEDGALFHFTASVENPADRFPWSEEINKRLLRVEKDVFLHGYHKVFVLLVNECRKCTKCGANKAECPHPESVRPMPESLGVDLFSTARNCGYSVNVLTSEKEKMDRFAILLVR